MKNALETSQILDTFKSASAIAYAQSRRERPESEYHRGRHDAYQHAIALLKTTDDAPKLEVQSLVLFVGVQFLGDNHPAAMIIDVNKLELGIIRSAIVQAFESDTIVVVPTTDFTLADVNNMKNSRADLPVTVHGRSMVKLV